MNPIDILYSWQAVLLASAVVGLTQLVKTLYDVYRGHVAPIETPTLRTAAQVGKDLRKDDVIFDRFVLPMCPIVFGMILAVVIPARPDVIMTYITVHKIGHFSAYAIYIGWGAACGQFADYIFSKVRTTFKTFVPGPGSGEDS